MDWTQVDIFTTTSGIEPVAAVLLDLGVGGYTVQDAADFEAFLQGKNGRWDYIDDALMRLREAETTLTVYLGGNEQGAAQLGQLQDALLRLRSLDQAGEWGRLVLELHTVREQDWSDAWKRYYTPVKAGERLVICPSWEEYAPAAGEVVLQMDPGMAFGTGTHETTRLCLQAAETYVRPGEQVLDIGCGSGILSVAALLLGARSALGVDIDQVAVQVARENAARNRVEDRCVFSCGTLADIRETGFDLIFANIVADVILSIAPQVPGYLKKGGVFLASGILNSRETQVRGAVEGAGLRLLGRREANDWVLLAFGGQ